MNAQTDLVSNEYMADSLLSKIYLDRQQAKQTVDLSAIEAAIEQNQGEEFVIAKTIGQAIMAIFDKGPYYVSLSPEDYSPHTQILHEQVTYCKTKNFHSLTLFTLDVLLFVYDYGYEKDQALAVCYEALDYYESLSKESRAKVRGLKYLLASFSYGIVQQKMMYNEYEGVKEWIDLAFEKGMAFHQSARNQKSSVVFYARPLSEMASYYLQLNKPDSAVYYWDLAAKESEKCENFEMMLAVLNQKARLFLMQESYREALDVYFKNLEIAESVKNTNVEVTSLYGIATCHNFLGNRDKAKKYYHRLMGKISKKDEIQIGLLPMVYAGISSFYESDGSLDSSIYYKQKEKQVYIDLGGHPQMFIANIELATLYQVAKDTIEADKAFAEAIELGIPPVNDRNLVLGLAAIASYLDRTGDYRNMIFYAKQSFNLSKEMHLVGEGLQAAEQLVKGYLYLEKRDSATKYLSEFKNLQKEFFAIAQDSALLDLQTKYETKEKEKEIVALDAQNKLERQNRNLSIGFMIFAIFIALGMIALYFKQKRVSAELRNLQNTKDKLFSIIAHDLRTPFNALMGFSKTIQDSGELKKSPELKSSVEAIHESSRTAYFLFEDLLAWAKTQTGQLSFSPEDLSIGNSLQECIGPLLGMIQFKNISIERQLSANWVHADAYMFNTVIRNLLTNAIKFLNYGGTLTIQSEENTKNWVRIVIRDNGVGMSEQEVLDLFEEKENKKGLGLLLCKDFVEKHGGKISAKSSLGKGTAIEFIIPKGTAKSVPEEDIFFHETNEPLPKLSPLAQKHLQEVAPEFEGKSVYYSTDLKKAVQKLRLYQENSLNEWLDLMERAIDESNVALYQKLIEEMV